MERARCAEALLRKKLVDPDHVLVWLDSEILDSDHPEPELLQASLATADVSSLREALTQIRGPGDPARGERIALSELHRRMLQGVIDEDEGWHCVQRFVQSFSVPVEEAVELENAAENADGDLIAHLDRYSVFLEELPNITMQRTRGKTRR